MAPGVAVTFVMERHLGHETYADNLRRAIEGRSDVTARWVDVAYSPTTTWWERIPSDGVRGTLRGRAEVGDGLVADRADVRIFNTQVPAVIGPRSARRRPYVLCTDVTPRQYDAMAAGYQHAADRPGPGRWLKHRWNRHVLGRAVAHAPWSSWVAESLVADYGVERSRIEVIAPGIDTSTWVAAPRPDRPVRYLFVGGDFARKGGEALLRAFAQVRGDDAELHVVTRSTLAQAPGVHVHHGLTPNDPALRQLFADSDVFVLPSGTETFGIAAVEAAAAGMPVIATRTGGLRDLVVEGTTGFVVDPGDEAALGRAMGELSAHPDLRRRMGAAGRQRAEREFDARTNADRLVRLALDHIR